MPLERGQRLAHYRIVRQIGQGGMGVVFLAEDTKLDRQVALKILPPEMAASEERLERFQREAKAVAALNHPHIVTLYSVEQEGDTHFLTMELVEGKSLDRALATGAMPLARVFEIGIAMADALAVAHEKGIVHRDLKPANVMLTQDGRIKVLDFGLAKLAPEPGIALGDVSDPEVSSAQTATRRADPLTAAGMVVGTVPYMSPEQAGGEALDARTDIFSLGVVLYEMTTGRRPFAGKNPAETISSILRDLPPPLLEARQDAPRHLARIIDHCLQKEPGDRFQTARDVCNELRHLRREVDSGASISVVAARQSARGSWSDPAAAASRRGQLRTTLTAGAVVLVLAAAGLGLWSVLGPTDPGASAEPPFQSMRMRPLLDDPNVFGATLSEDGRYLAYVKGPEGRWTLWVRQVSTGSEVRIFDAQSTRIRGVSFSRDGDRLYYLGRRPGTRYTSVLYEVPSLGGTPRTRVIDIDTALSFGPDGERAAFVRGMPKIREAHLIILDLDTAEETVLAALKPFRSIRQTRPAWSPDGKRIVVELRTDGQGTHFKLAAFDSESGHHEPITEPSLSSFTSFAWLPDGQGLVGSTKSEPGLPRQVVFIPYPKGEPSQITNDLDNYGEVSLSADGSSIAAVRTSRESRLWTVSAKDPGLPQSLTSPSRAEGIDNVVALPEGSLLYTAVKDRDRQIWRMDADGSGKAPLTAQAGQSYSLRVLPDQRSAVFTHSSRSEPARHIWRVDLPGGGVRQLTHGSGEDVKAADPAGQTILFGRDDRLYEIWRVALEGGEPEKLLEGFIFTDRPYSLDGRHLAYTTYEEAEGRSRPGVHVVPAAGGDPVARFLPPPDFSGLTWAADGDGLLYVHAVDGVENLWMQPLDGGDPIQLTHLTEGRMGSPRPSPDGGLIALERLVGEAENLWTVKPDGTDAVPLTDFHDGEIFDLAWAHDSRSLFFVQGDVRREVVLLEEPDR